MDEVPLMPSHPDRVRSAGLSKGYQFGDGRLAGAAAWLRTDDGLEALRQGHRAIYDEHGTITVSLPKSFRPMLSPWRPPHLNAAERLARQAHWNVIEGEHDEVEGVPGPYLSRWRVPLRLELANRLAPFTTDRDPGDEA